MQSGPHPEPPRQAATSEAVVQPEIVGSAAGSPTGKLPVPQIIVQPSGGRFVRFFGWLGWVGLALCIPVILGMVAAFHDYFDTTGGIQERYHSLSKDGRDKVAVIKIEGIIRDGDGFAKRQIDRVRGDDRVKAIVVRIDSPGGTVTGSDYLYHHLKKLRKEKDVPLVVSMGGMAASGGYYVAMAVGEQDRSIFAEHTTTTGSIGVIIPHFDVSGLMERHQIRDDSIVSHPRKQMLSMTKETTPEEREILQRYVNQSFDRFKDVVRSGRPKFQRDQTALDSLATGEIFSATQALENGLVDEIGFVEDAIDRAIQLAQLSPENVRVVTYRRNPSLLDVLTYSRSRPDLWESLALELSVPRAYYLLSSHPALVRVPLVR